MSELIVGALAEKAVEHAVSRVIARLSRYRAERFFAGLIQGMRSGELDEEAAAEAIGDALENNVKAEVIFEAYRKVCLSASRNAGPTLIGVITSKALAEDRATTDCEDRLLMAAEALSDAELEGLEVFLREAATEQAPSNWGTVYVYGVEEHVDSNHPKEVDVGPLDLAEHYGVWASKCSNLGIIRQSMTTSQRAYSEDGERYIDMDGVVTTYTWRVGISSEFFPLLPLLSAAVATVKESATVEA